MPQLGTSSYALFGRPGAGVTTAARYLRAITGSDVLDGIYAAEDFQQVKEDGYVLIRIDAPWVTRVDRLRIRGGLNPTQELVLADSSAYRPDYNIVNDDDLNALCEQLMDVVNKEARRT